MSTKSDDTTEPADIEVPMTAPFGEREPPSPSETDEMYIRVTGIDPADIDDSIKESLIVNLQNLLLADYGLPIEGVDIVQEPDYVVEFTTDV